MTVLVLTLHNLYKALMNTSLVHFQLLVIYYTETNT